MEVLEKLPRRYKAAGAEYKRKLLEQALQLLGYHRKAAIRALGRAAVEGGPLSLREGRWSMSRTFWHLG